MLTQSLSPEEKLFFGELICLARLTDGNPHLVTPELEDFLFAAVAAPKAERALLLPEIQAWKRRLSPNCAACAHPCGRFDAYDFDSPIPEPPEKAALLRAIPAAAHRDVPPSKEAFRNALAAIGIEEVNPAALTALLETFRE